MAMCNINEEMKVIINMKASVIVKSNKQWKWKLSKYQWKLAKASQWRSKVSSNNSNNMKWRNNEKRKEIKVNKINRK